MKTLKPILILFMLTTFFSCKKTEEPEPEQKKFFNVTYVVEFPKATDFTITGSNYDGTIKDTVWNKQKHSFAGKIEDLKNNYGNAWGGGCSFKVGDKNNILVKVAILIGSDTIKRGQLNTGCLQVN